MQHHLSARTVVVMVGILEGRAIEIQEHWLWSLPIISRRIRSRAWIHLTDPLRIPSGQRFP